MKNDKIYKGIFSLSAGGYLKSNNKKKLDKNTVEKLVAKSVENYNSKFPAEVVISLFSIPDDKQVYIHTNQYKVTCSEYGFTNKNITMNLVLEICR